MSFEACVVKESELRGEESAATVELSAFLQKDRWVLCKGKGILKMVAPARETPSGPELNLVRGDKIRGWATWNVPRNYENPGSADSAGQLTRRGVFLTGRIKSLRLLETIPGGCSDPWNGVANYVGARVRKSLEPIREWGKGQPAAILASLIIGDYSGLDNTTRETFQNSGTFHVLVVWGTARGLDCGSAAENMQTHLAAGTDSLLRGVPGNPAIHVRCRFPGKHHTLFMDVPFVSDRANDLPSCRYGKHPARIRPRSPSRAALLAARSGIPAFISFGFGHRDNSRAGHQ